MFSEKKNVKDDGEVLISKKNSLRKTHKLICIRKNCSTLPDVETAEGQSRQAIREMLVVELAGHPQGSFGTAFVYAYASHFYFFWSN